MHFLGGKPNNAAFFKKTSGEDIFLHPVEDCWGNNS